MLEMRVGATCLVLAVVAGGGCGRVGFGLTSAHDPDAADADPGDDGSVHDASSGVWGTPTVLLDLPADDPSLTADGLELFCNVDTFVYVATRADTSSAWSPAAQLTSISQPLYSPHISADGLTLWGVDAALDIVVTTRVSRTDSFGPLAVIPEVSTANVEDGPAVTADQLVMVFDSDRSGSRRIWISTRASTAAAWGAPQEIAEIDQFAARPHLTEDRLAIYFESANDVWFAERTTSSVPFGTATIVSEVVSTDSDQDPWLSADARQLVFSSGRGGIARLYHSVR